MKMNSEEPSKELSIVKEDYLQDDEVPNEPLILNMMVEDNIPIMTMDERVKGLHSDIKRLYGCINCEWRGSDMCPYGFNNSPSGKKKHHFKGICPSRYRFLLSLSKTYSETGKVPTLSEWRRDINISMAHKEFLKDKFKEERLAKQIEEFKPESEDDRKIMHRLKQEYFSLKNFNFMVWKEMVKFDDAQVERETPKNINMNVKSKISTYDINEILRTYSQDADWKERKD